MESVTNVYNRQMFSKLLLLGTELERLFTERGSGLRSQLCGYLARHSLEGIRNELLFRTDATYREKCVSVKNFVENPMLMQAFSYAIPRIKDSKTRFKLLLAKHKFSGLLCLLYLARATVMARCVSEN